MIKAYLQNALCVKNENAAAGTGVYAKYKESFLKTVAGAKSKELLVCDEEDVQALHGFGSVGLANAYLKTELFKKDVVREPGSLLDKASQIRIYAVA